jgi:hypothetical protein
VEDLELQERYDRFQKDLQMYKDNHNEIVPTVNENLEKLRTLKAAVLAQALSGVLAPQAVEKIKDIEKENQDLIKNIEFYQGKIKETKDLIEKYENWSNKRLFVWYQALKAVDPETKPYLEWQETYKNRII